MLPPPNLIRKEGYTVADDSAVGTKFRYLENEVANTPLKHIFSLATGWGASEDILTALCREYDKQLHLLYPQIPGGSHSTARSRAFENGVHIEKIPTTDPREARAVGNEKAKKNNGKLIVLSGDKLLYSYAQAAQSLDFEPDIVVTASSSGMLCSGLQITWRKAIHETLVVLKLPNANMGNAIVHFSTQELSEPSTIIPPFPCNLHFEGKAWEWLLHHKKPSENILFWNSAGPN